MSGFCIHLRASSQKRNHKQYNIDWKLFFQKSFYRIYPPYLVAILLSISCAYFLHSRYVLDGNSFLMDLVSHILLFHNLTVDYSVGLGNGAFWFLGMEAQIYLLYPILVWLIFRISYKFTWIVILIFTIAWRIYSKNFHDFSIDIFSLEIGDWSKWAFYYWVVWLLGAFSAEAYQENLKLPKWAYSCSKALIFLFFGIIFSDNTLGLLKNTSLSALVQPMSSATTSILHLLSDFSF
ncbi:MAG: acyltransferase family protein, partial [Sphaerospermopsis kisseleviana]